MSDIFLSISFRNAVSNHPTFNKDIILLPDPTWDQVCKHKTKMKLHEIGHILSAFEINKMWDCQTVNAEIHQAFKEQIPEDVKYAIVVVTTHLKNFD